DVLDEALPLRDVLSREQAEAGTRALHGKGVPARSVLARRHCYLSPFQNPWSSPPSILKIATPRTPSSFARSTFSSMACASDHHTRLNVTSWPVAFACASARAATSMPSGVLRGAFA